MSFKQEEEEEEVNAISNQVDCRCFIYQTHWHICACIYR